MRFTPILLLLAACASTPNVPAGTRGAGEAKRMIESTKDRSAYVAMLSDEQVYEAMPMMKGRKIPNLMRVATLMPNTMKAEMAAWGALNREGTLDRRLRSELFYVVSSANDCAY